MPRWSVQVAAELARQYIDVHGGGGSICFGDITKIAAETTAETEMKAVKDRLPTPVVSSGHRHKEADM